MIEPAGQVEPQAQRFRWGLDTLTFSGGQEIPLDFGSVLILIGPNRAGKSRALRDIETFFTSPGSPRVVLSNVSPVREGTGDVFYHWLKANYPTRFVEGQRRFHTKAGDLPDQIARNIPDTDNVLREAHPFLVHRLDTENRLTITNPIRQIRLYEEPPSAYIHVLQTSELLQKKASEIVRSAFGVDLIINWVGGRDVSFHVGQEPTRTRDHDRVSETYAEEVLQQPRLELEGDGIRSFVGSLLAGLCGAHPILMIDEPEAFLHPPQARRLSAALAKTSVELNRQLIIATHSADVVRGALQASDRVSVCRLTREGDLNYAALLGSAELAKLWSKPLLRSSAAIDGLFHEGVVVCEGDADCRFYEAILRRLETTGRLSRAADLHFVHGGGKGQLAALARAYTSLNTKTAVLADLDLLSDQAQVAGVVSALNSELSEHEALFSRVHATLGGAPPVVSADDLASKVKEICDRSKGRGALSSEGRREVLSLLAGTADWSQAKKHGTNAARGGEKKAADKLLKLFSAIGLFLVPVGELEGWWRAGPADKGEWAVDAIEEIAKRPDSLTEATEFVARLCDWFGYSPTSEGGEG